MLTDVVNCLCFHPRNSLLIKLIIHLATLQHLRVSKNSPLEEFTQERYFIVSAPLISVEHCYSKHSGGNIDHLMT